MKKFYKKELISNRLSLPTGKIVPFEALGNSDTGILVTEDDGLSSELDKAVALNRGGVISISEEEFEELKKNPPGGRLRLSSINAQTVKSLLRDSPDRSVKAVAGEESAPMEVPEPKGLVTISSIRALNKKKAAEAALQPV